MGLAAIGDQGFDTPAGADEEAGEFDAADDQAVSRNRLLSVDPPSDDMGPAYRLRLVFGRDDAEREGAVEGRVGEDFAI
jgi:hypothetical protein